MCVETILWNNTKQTMLLLKGYVSKKYFGENFQL